MAKDEFSVNELEPVRSKNEEIVEPSKVEIKEEKKLVVEQTVSKSEELKKEEYEGPTIKELLVNSFNPDYDGPTAKEIVVNSVKVDNTKKKNMVGLVVLIVVLLLVGVIVVAELASEDKQPETNYLNGLPSWSTDYNKYISTEYKDLVAYELAFVDFDFDDTAEAIISYADKNNKVYEIFDVKEDTIVSFKVEELTDLYMLYSFSKRNVIWYLNTTSNSNDMNLIDIGKRINDGVDYEINLTIDTLSNFKGDHFTLSYDIKYTNVSFRTYEKNFSEAVKMYENEKDNITSIANNIKDKYDDTL